MTSRWLLLCLLAVPTRCTAEVPVYDQKTFGFDRKNWDIICAEAPYVSGTLIGSSVGEALKREGWYTATRGPVAVEVNRQCVDLGWLTPEAPDAAQP